MAPIGKITFFVLLCASCVTSSGSESQESDGSSTAEATATGSNSAGSTTLGADTASTTGATAESSSSSGVTGSEVSGDDHLPPPPDGGSVKFECDLFAQDECKFDPRPTHYCAPFDPVGTSSWSGSTCVPLPMRPAATGSTCELTDGPIDGQSGCGPGLACAAAADSMTGLCVPLCDAGHACDVGACTFCNLAEDFTAYGVCLEAVDCEGMQCPVAGCLG